MVEGWPKMWWPSRESNSERTTARFCSNRETSVSIPTNQDPRSSVDTDSTSSGCNRWRGRDLAGITSRLIPNNIQTRWDRKRRDRSELERISRSVLFHQSVVPLRKAPNA
jgi:uncharacterized protein YjiS (DUF1127 family)